MGNRSNIILQCEVCKYRYHTTKNKKKKQQKLQLKKYCPDCRKHMLFTEKK